MKIISNTNQFNGQYHSEEEVRQAVLAEVKRYHNVGESEADVVEFFESLDMGDEFIHSSDEQTFTVEGVEEEGCNWIPSYDVTIKGNYVDAGSEDYIYTVFVYER